MVHLPDEHTNPPLSNDETSIFENELRPLPNLYQRDAILALAFLFSTLFSAVLVAINIKETGKQRGIWQVLTFAALFLALQIAIVTAMPNLRFSNIIFNLTGGQLLRTVFWKHYIGNNTRYNKRSLLVPVVVGILIGVVLFLLSTYGY